MATMIDFDLYEVLSEQTLTRLKEVVAGEFTPLKSYGNSMGEVVIEIFSQDRDRKEFVTFNKYVCRNILRAAPFEVSKSVNLHLVEAQDE